MDKVSGAVQRIKLPTSTAMKANTKMIRRMGVVSISGPVEMCTKANTSMMREAGKAL